MLNWRLKNNYINCLNFQIKDNPYSNIVAFSLKKMLFTILSLLVPSLAVAVSNTGGAVKLDLTISDEHMYYIENLALGTPPQFISNVIVDSGSSDLMIVDSIYNFSASSSLYNSNQTAIMKYGYGGQFPVYFINETIRSNDWKLSNLSVGLANISDMDSFSGILGIGFTRQELFKTNYLNFPYLLKDQGYTKSVLFSFNGQDQNPSIIFGGISTNIIDGPLVRAPFIKVISFINQLDYWLMPTFTVNQIKLGDTIVSNQKTLYQIDSGTNGFVPPTPVLNNILKILGDDYIQDDNGNIYFDIKYIEGLNITFSVQGYDIGFQLVDIVGDTIERNSTTFVALNVASCDIGYNAYEGLLPNLIFKYHYAIFDYDNAQIYFGKYKNSNGEANVVAVENGYQLPVPTVDVPDVEDTYSVIYIAESETTVTVAPTEVQSTYSSFSISEGTSSNLTSGSTSDDKITSVTSNPQYC